jgi:hypothetical protein
VSVSIVLQDKGIGMSSLTQKLKTYAEHQLNVMLIGSHGIGKSTIVKTIAEELGMRFKYYSSSTLDPFADLVGIPTPDKEAEVLKFYRPKDLEEAEFVFFDELNRAHPRVLNAVLEIVQFKSVNGYKLPNLKMVWSAINPPGDDYQVEELDPALIDRFHIYIKMKPEINLDYLKTKMRPEVAGMLKDWWENQCDKEQQRLLTPRRIEYLGFMISSGIPWRDAMPQGHTFPVDDLHRRIKIINNEEEDFVISKDNIIAKKDVLLKRIAENPSTAIPIANAARKFTESEMFECRDLLEAMPKELVHNLGQHKFLLRRRALKEMFVNNNIDFSKYPKIAEGFGFNEIK